METIALRLFTAKPREERGKIARIVRQFLRGVVDDASGRFKDVAALKAKSVRIFCGDATFGHTWRGNGTFMTVTTLLNACASLNPPCRKSCTASCRSATGSCTASTSIPVLTHPTKEPYSSQTCAFCKLALQRLPGEYKVAICTECELELHRDAMAAACMATIGLSQMAIGERPGQFKHPPNGASPTPAAKAGSAIQQKTRPVRTSTGGAAVRKRKASGSPPRQSLNRKSPRATRKRA